MNIDSYCAPDPSITCGLSLSLHPGGDRDPYGSPPTPLDGAPVPVQNHPAVGPDHRHLLVLLGAAGPRPRPRAAAPPGLRHGRPGCAQPQVPAAAPYKAP